MRINLQITSPEVRLVDSNGDMVGVVSIDHARKMAQAQSLDLVEIAPTAEPPVCKILDFAKFKYEEKKKKTELKKQHKQTRLVVKEVKLKPNIATNDLNTKIRQMRGFIEDQAHVKVSIIHRGRLAIHKENSRSIFDKLIQDLADIAKPESDPKFMGNILFMKLIPVQVKK